MNTNVYDCRAVMPCGEIAFKQLRAECHPEAAKRFAIWAFWAFDTDLGDESPMKFRVFVTDQKTGESSGQIVVVRLVPVGQGYTPDELKEWRECGRDAAKFCGLPGQSEGESDGGS